MSERKQRHVRRTVGLAAVLLATIAVPVAADSSVPPGVDDSVPTGSAPESTVEVPETTVEPPETTVDVPETTVEPPETTVEPPETTVDSSDVVGGGPWDAESRGGLTAVGTFMTMSVGVPSEPRNVVVEVRNGSVKITWVEPSSTGSGVVNGYVVQSSVAGGEWADVATLGSTSRAVVILGLTNGTSYRFRVLARNAAGLSEPSSEVPGVPGAAPSAPRSVIAEVRNGSVKITWVEPSSTGSGVVNGYVVQSSVAGGEWADVATLGSTSRASSIMGLTNGTSYRFRVLARNAAGLSEPSPAVSGVPRTVPSVPRGVVTEDGVGKVKITWEAPSSTGGAVVNGYVVQSSVVGGEWSDVATLGSTSRASSITGLTGGKPYRFRVLARNAAGLSAPSSVVIGLPKDPPSPFPLPANSGTGRRMVYHRGQQRVWAVEANGNVAKTHRVSGRIHEPYAGTYSVFSRSLHTYAAGNPSVRWMYMVRFTKGFNGGNIGFHEIPHRNGVRLQTEAQLGLPLSGGCVRQSTPDAIWVWNWAPVGTKVVVL